MEIIVRIEVEKDPHGGDEVEMVRHWIENETKWPKEFHCISVRDDGRDCDTHLTIDVKKAKKVFKEWHLDEGVTKAELRSYADRLITRLKKEARA